MKPERPDDSGQTTVSSPPAARATSRPRVSTGRLLRPAPLIVTASTMILVIWIGVAVAAAVGSALVGVMAACLVMLAGVIAFTLVGLGSNRTRR